MPFLAGQSSKHTSWRTRGAVVTAGLLAAGSSVVLIQSGGAQAASLDMDYNYPCKTVAAGLDLGVKDVGVRAQVEVPDSVKAGNTIPARKTQITLTLPEDLRSATYGLLSARSAGGYSDNSSISITANGVDDALSIPINNLSAPPTDVPASASPPWTIPTEGDVPAITVPDGATDAAELHMPAAFTIKATLYSEKSGGGNKIGGQDGVTMDCTLDTSGPNGEGVLGSIPIEAAPTNQAPVAKDVTATTEADTPVDVTLEATDPDGDDLTYSTTDPTHGTIDGDGSTVTYTPEADFSGEDSFEYTADDGNGGTDTATVTITVTEDDTTTPPVGDQDIDSDYLYKCDVDANGLKLGIKDVGVNAQVTVPGSAAPGERIPSRKTKITLTMPEDLRSATVGLLGAKTAGGYSDDASITITANGVSDPLVVPISNLSAPQSDVPTTAGAEWLIPTEGDVPAITVPAEATDEAVLTMPDAFNIKATLVKADGSLVGGKDAVKLACDLSADGTLGTITISGDVVDSSVPVLDPVAVSGTAGEPITITLSGTDPKGGDLAFDWTDPEHGTLEEATGARTTSTTVVYTSEDAFVGTDTFTFKATSSGGVESDPQTVTITVKTAEGGSNGPDGNGGDDAGDDGSGNNDGSGSNGSGSNGSGSNGSGDGTTTTATYTTTTLPNTGGASELWLLAVGGALAGLVGVGVTRRVRSGR